MQQYLVFIILIFTMTLFIWGRWRYDVVALIALTATVAIGVVPFDKAFLGFSNAAVITVATVMVITEAIAQSGVVDHVVKQLAPVTSKIWLHISILTLMAGFLSAFMNNVGALALLMPIAMRTAANNDRSPALILMPIAFGSILGGMTTLIGTPPNILIANYRQEVTGQSFSMFDFTPVGIVVALLGVAFIVLFGWRLIPKARLRKKVVEDVFQIQDYVTEVRITEESPLVGMCFHEIEDFSEAEYMILGMIRNEKKRLSIPAHLELKEKDILIIEAGSKDLEKIVDEFKVELVGNKDITAETLKSKSIELIEVVVVPGSQLEGRTPNRIRLRTRYRINLLALSRQGEAFKQRLKNVKLMAGDILLLQGDAETLNETVAEIGFLPLAERGVRLGLETKKFLPLGIFALSLLLIVINVLPVEIAFSAAVLLLVLFNVVPIRKVYNSIDWSIVVLLGAMIPVGGALATTGGTQLIAKWIIIIAGQTHPVVILGLLLFVTMALSDVMNNAATAVVMAPISISIAQTLGYSIDPFLMAVAIGASCAFLTPIGHQNNTLIMGPGGYHFGDYWRMGLPLEILIIAVSLPMILFVWPLQ